MKKMNCSKIACLWTLRFEVLGVILLVIATCLTISTHNGIGIAALFAAGVILCLFNKLCCYVCPSKHSSCPICESPHSNYPGDPEQTPVNEENEAKQAMDNEGGNQADRER